MEIKKEVVTKEKFFVLCDKCKSKITGTSEKQLLPNLRIHDTFCEDKNEVSNVK